MFIEIARRPVACALLVSLLVGFADGTPSKANVDSLDEVDVASSVDVALTGFNLASSAELSRYWAAMDHWHRALFPKMPPPSVTMGQYLPMLRLSFRSQHQLFDPIEPGTRFAKVYLCGAWDRKWGVDGIITADVLWRGRIVDQEVSQQIAEQPETAPRSQEYEIFFRYSYWDPSAVRERENHIQLLPVPDDICLTFQDSPVYAVSSTGELFRPVEFLRIDKKAVNEAVGDLPRLLAVP